MTCSYSAAVVETHATVGLVRGSYGYAQSATGRRLERFLVARVIWRSHVNRSDQVCNPSRHSLFRGTRFRRWSRSSRLCLRRYLR